MKLSLIQVAFYAIRPENGSDPFCSSVGSQVKLNFTIASVSIPLDPPIVGLIIRWSRNIEITKLAVELSITATSCNATVL